jgi:uncharacterized protein YbcI
VTVAELPPASGRLNGALATAIVQVHTRSVGRGPTKAQVTQRENVVVALLSEARTQPERWLIGSGDAGGAIRLRRDLERSMRDGLVAAVEELTGCRVVAFLSDNCVEPDLIAQIYVLDQPVRAGGLTPAGRDLIRDACP